MFRIENTYRSFFTRSVALDLTKHQIKKFNKNKPETIFLTISISGGSNKESINKKLMIKANSDYRLIVIMVSLLLKELSNSTYQGVLFPYEIISIDDIIKYSKKIEIKTS